MEKSAGRLTSDLDPVNSQQRVALRIARTIRKEQRAYPTAGKDRQKRT